MGIVRTLLLPQTPTSRPGRTGAQNLGGLQWSSVDACQGYSVICEFLRLCAISNRRIEYKTLFLFNSSRSLPSHLSLPSLVGPTLAVLSVSPIFFADFHPFHYGQWQ